MTVNRNVHVAFFESTEIHHGGDSVTDTEKTVCSNVGGNHAGECKGKTATQELLHDGSPVTVDAASCLMVGFKYLVVCAYRNNIKLFPYLLSFFWRQSPDCFIVIRYCSGQILKQCVRKFGCYLINASVFGFNAEGFCSTENLLCPDYRNVKFTFSSPLKVQNDFAGMHAVLSGSGRSGT